ncbi:Ff.00g043640.m01.CDS01 [Fusarium sp. VM40]|nr:Ff.00g043640.m01.CDS01 [Fusarium sp. VM40]
MPNAPPTPETARFLEVNDNCWIIDHLMVTRHQHKRIQPCWPDGEGGFFSIDDAPTLTPPTRPPSHVCPISDAGNQFPGSLTWKIGLAHLRIDFNNLGTSEHVTLETLAKRSLGFQIPQVYYHKHLGNSYSIVFSDLPGNPLIKAWPTANQAARTRWTQQIAEAYHELSKWRGDRICAVDGGNLQCFWLSSTTPSVPGSYNPEVLRANCEEMGLDCSELVFAHNYMMPLSFTVDEVQGLVGICRWEMAGFLPRDWIRTMTRANSFTQSWQAVKSSWSESDIDDFGDKIESALKDKGFKEFWLNECRWRGEKNRRQKQEEANRLQPPTV